MSNETHVFVTISTDEGEVLRAFRVTDLENLDPTGTDYEKAMAVASLIRTKLEAPTREATIQVGGLKRELRRWIRRRKELNLDVHLLNRCLEVLEARGLRLHVKDD